MVTGADQVAPPLAERMYTTSASVPFQLDQTTCSVAPSSARAGKLLSRKVAPGSGLGMSLMVAMSLVANVAPPLVETLETRCGADQVRPPLVVLEMTIAELPPLNRVQVT